MGAVNRHMYVVTQMTLKVLNHTSLVPRSPQKAQCIWYVFYVFLCRISPAFVWRHTRNAQKTWWFLNIMCDVTLHFRFCFLATTGIPGRLNVSYVYFNTIFRPITRFAGLLDSKRGERNNTSLSVTIFIYLNLSYIYSTRTTVFVCFEFYLPHLLIHK